MREDYRPFAPSVLVEHANEFFEIPENVPADRFPFMNFVLKVKEGKRDLLGAVTHVDGTARVQTVLKETNPRYYDLIASFGKKTGVPVLLNTSFNNNHEPIVNSVYDAVVCFLTTQLSYLCVGNYLVTKRNIVLEDYLNLVPSIPEQLSIDKRKKFNSDSSVEYLYEICFSYFYGKTLSVSEAAYEFLMQANGEQSVGEILQKLPGLNKASMINEILSLWTKRLIKLVPSQ